MEGQQLRQTAAGNLAGNILKQAMKVLWESVLPVVDVNDLRLEKVQFWLVQEANSNNFTVSLSKAVGLGPFQTSH